MGQKVSKTIESLLARREGNMNKCIEQCLLIEQKERNYNVHMHIVNAEILFIGKMREKYRCIADYSEWSGRGVDGDNLRMRNAQV